MYDVSVSLATTFPGGPGLGSPRQPVRVTAPTAAADTAAANLRFMMFSCSMDGARGGCPGPVGAVSDGHEGVLTAEGERLGEPVLDRLGGLQGGGRGGGGGAEVSTAEGCRASPGTAAETRTVPLA